VNRESILDLVSLQDVKLNGGLLGHKNELVREEVWSAMGSPDTVKRS